MLSCEEFLSDEFPKGHLAIVPARSKYTWDTSFYTSKGIEPDKNRRIDSIIGARNNDASLWSNENQTTRINLANNRFLSAV